MPPPKGSSAEDCNDAGIDRVRASKVWFNIATRRIGDNPEANSRVVPDADPAAGHLASQSFGKEGAMEESRFLDGPSAEELAERLGELLSDDEVENVVGGSKEFSLLDTLA
jgi:hypothetical protein